jgi:hypothetical protein
MASIKALVELFEGLSMLEPFREYIGVRVL